MLPQGHTGISTDQGGKIFLDLALGAAYTPLDWPKRDDLHADQRTFLRGRQLKRARPILSLSRLLVPLLTNHWLSGLDRFPCAL